MVSEVVETLSLFTFWEEDEMQVFIYLRNVLVTLAYAALLTA